ncbi:Eco57I restriction-modification methylase domain-containing protein [Microbacterium sp. A84]|uniref:Eco57I restriction-modification methylase domain-containing protein n=1 Tax=Microbacterium sp. A84 TaxID=3450715 RepID=UPI003F4436B0
MASDAFIVGEDWISEHYFSTDSTKQSFQGRVTACRKDWDGREDAGERTPRGGLSAARGDLVTALSALAPSGDDTSAVDLAAHRERILEPLFRALGYADSRWTRKVSGPVILLAPKDSADSPAAAVILARPVSDVSDLLTKTATTLLETFTPEGESDQIVSVAKALSWIFSGDDAPTFAVVLTGAQALVAERERWAEGRYLAVDVQLALDRGETKKRGGEFDRAVAILSAESVLPGVDGTTWWAETLDDSVKHTVGVSKDLREGVRESIEIIANEVVRRRATQGLDPLPAAEANTLARQSLRYLYRILFLLFAEASPELKVLPVGAPEYSLGYGLDRLRELVLVELGEESRRRSHLYQSLRTLFQLVDAGHDASPSASLSEPVERHDAGASSAMDEGLVFNPLNADLFRVTAVSLIDETGLGDGALQRVLSLLLLTREERTKRGSDRGFISYADLGINQLGAVYEGLMSYSGFFAETDLYEVAKDGDSSKGSWVVPVDRADGIAPQHFVMTEDPHTGQKVQRRYQNGEFVYRLSGRERQTSASYYSPEVLTRFVVGQALEELLDQDGHKTSAEEILGLSVCEPALGSGAFAIEAVRQLADEYLRRREDEIGERIDPDQRPRELQKAKAAIALHQVYGVDLNATAVELAEISLWLDTMVDGLQAPWFGLRLRRGNSLVGARRAVYSEKQVKDKAWLKDVPVDVSVSTLVEEMREGRVASATSGKIHHFLLPAEGWGAAVDAKEAKALAPEATAALRTWRGSMRKKPSSKQIKELQNLSHRVETLWQFTLRRLEIAESQVRRQVDLWNDPREEVTSTGAVTREEVERFLQDPDGAYQRLRRVMDAWCAMWFWPLTESLTAGATPPSLDDWIAGIRALLGVHVETKPQQARHGAQMLGLPTNWHDLAGAEAIDASYASAGKLEDVLTEHPWLAATGRIADANGFFHWELDYASVFAQGGFDLQVGNPPWVRPRSDVDALLAEGDPWWQLKAKSTASEDSHHRTDALAVPGVRELVVDGTTDVSSIAAFAGSAQMYPYLAGLQPDLYRCFMSQTWAHAKLSGSVSLIHPETHFTDEKAGTLRRETYHRLRRHWQFINELSLFEVHHLVSYGVHVYRSPSRPDFVQATSLYHPSTVEASFKHDGSGVEPGLKDDEGRWDLRAHSSRIQYVDESMLKTWHAVLEDPAVPIEQTRMVYTVNRATSAVLAKLASAPRIGSLGLQFSRGWDESIDRKKGRFDSEWGVPESWDSVILQGPHLHVGNPFYKSPNPTMLHNQDWTAVDLEALHPNAIPATQYKPRGDRATYAAAYGQWDADTGKTSVRQQFRITYRAMAANTGERTLIPALIPPGTAHVNGLFSFGLPGGRTEDLLLALGSVSSLVADFAVRAAPKSGIYQGVLERLPLARNARYATHIIERVLRLNALTAAFAPIWEDVTETAWSVDVPLRRARDRRNAMIEVDALVALSLGIDIEELVTIYRTQFPVLYGYDQEEYLYDANGRIVPTALRQTWKRLGELVDGDSFPPDARSLVHPGSGRLYQYELPFGVLDREEDLRRAYADLA